MLRSWYIVLTLCYNNITTTILRAVKKKKASHNIDEEWRAGAKEKKRNGKEKKRSISECGLKRGNCLFVEAAA